jgi:hypothetical protein
MTTSGEMVASTLPPLPAALKKLMWRADLYAREGVFDFRDVSNLGTANWFAAETQAKRP